MRTPPAYPRAPQAAAAHLLTEPDATTAPLRTTNMSSGLQQGSKAAMKAAASDGVPHHKSEGAAPATKTKGDGHSRNILRKGGPAVERKAGTSGHALQDPSMEGAPPVDPGDPNFESPDDPERVSSKD